MERKDSRYPFRDRRDLPLELCEVKFLAAKPEDPVRFQGYASVWGRTDTYGDTILKGAFTKAITTRRPMMFYGHNPGRVPGKWLTYSEDDKGLAVEGELTPGHSEAADLAASLKHGSINGLSIGGYTVDSKNTDAGGRVIKEFDLWEISPVSMPAETEARIDTATVKSLLDECNTISEFEALLREVAGLSKSTATAFVARMRRIERGEPGRDEAANRAAGELLAAIKGSAIPQLIGASP